MNPMLAAGIGAVVGMFLSPAAWLALLALTAGRAAVDDRPRPQQDRELEHIG